MQLGDALKFDTLTASTATGDDVILAFDRGTNTVRSIALVEMEKLYGIAEGAPEFEGSVILDPAGDNNAILIASTDPDIEAAEILIDDDVDRTGLSVTGGSLLSAVSGDKRVVQVGGTLTDGVNPVVFPLLSELTIEGGDLFWEIGSSEDLPYFVVSGTPFGSWFIGAITETGSAEWSSTDEVATPDLVTTWTPEAPATGTPTVTAHPATAAQVIAAINAEEIEGVTAANAPGNDGSGFVENVEMVPFIYTSDTPSLPLLRYDADKLYVNVGTTEAPVWESKTFDP
jgi:hypothetical protein